MNKINIRNVKNEKFYLKEIENKINEIVDFINNKDNPVPQTRNSKGVENVKEEPDFESFCFIKSNDWD